MHRTVLLAFLVAPTILACAHAQTSPRASAARVPEPPAVSVSYRMLRVGDGEGVVLSGRSLIGPHGGTSVESIPAHSRANEKLEIVVRPGDDGAVLVQANYRESSAEGAELDWRPALRLARGTTTRAEVNGAGWGRALEITVE